MILNINKEELIKKLKSARDGFIKEEKKALTEFEKNKSKLEEKIKKLLLKKIEAYELAIPVGWSPSTTVSVSREELGLKEWPKIPNNSSIIDSIDKQIRQLELVDGEVIKIKNTDDYFRYI
jgi:hypothetical protein